MRTESSVPGNATAGQFLAEVTAAQTPRWDHCGHVREMWKLGRKPEGGTKTVLSDPHIVRLRTTNSELLWNSKGLPAHRKDQGRSLVPPEIKKKGIS